MPFCLMLFIACKGMHRIVRSFMRKMCLSPACFSQIMFYPALFICVVCVLTSIKLPCLTSGTLWYVVCLFSNLLGILLASLVIWRQPQSQKKVDFMVSSKILGYQAKYVHEVRTLGSHPFMN